MNNKTVANLLTKWAAYKSAEALREEAEAANNAEQQAHIEPIFAMAFPVLVAKGITYSNSWTCGEEQYAAITAWESESGVEAFCSETAAKNGPRIDELKKLELEAQDEVLNFALEMMEHDVSPTTLTDEQKQRFREITNMKGWNRDRQKFLEILERYISGIQSRNFTA